MERILGSWNECCRLLYLTALGLLSRTVAAEPMRHPRATGGVDAGFVRINPVPVQIWFLAAPLRSGSRRVARCINECPRRYPRLLPAPRISRTARQSFITRGVTAPRAESARVAADLVARDALGTHQVRHADHVAVG